MEKEGHGAKPDQTIDPIVMAAEVVLQLKVKPESEATPAGFNAESWSRRIRARFEALLGPERVVDIPLNMGGDDFARFGRELGVPSVYYRLGAVERGAFERRQTQPLPSLHSDVWAPDAREALPIGIQTIVAALREGLSIDQ
jgi:metal-dependent amidase/aminoacylase/carboxypeptidase family protein